MADFVAVLKKTIDAQADKSPELRQRVYAKARATIEQKLVTANASQAVAVRQRNILDAAIAEVEAFYGPPAVVEPVDDGFDDFAHDAKDASAPSDPEHDIPDDVTVTPSGQWQETQAPVQEDASFHAEREDSGDWKLERAKEKAEARRSEYIERSASQEKGSYKGLIAGLVALVVLGGVGAAVWFNKDQLVELASSLGRSDAPSQPGGSTDTGTTQPPAENTANTTGGTDTPEPSVQPPAGEQKLTQRLMPDGSEVDDGPAGGTPGVGEGKSTAAASTSAAAPTTTGEQAPAEQAAVVGQQALFYEEKGGTETGSVERGNVVWSVIQESPGDGQPEEPAVRATVTMPTSNIQLKMTLRKNTDQSIPASHLIEMVFTVPDDFSGGVIDNVQRITFKDTEQAAGNPLIAVPSKIADNFFIIWLNDAKTAQDTNLSLMRRLQWIDIPLSYRNGRRALISLEKGTPGEKVFTDVLGTN